MITATVTSKGQITIPKQIRTSLKLEMGDKVAFKILENGEVVIRPISKKVSDMYGILNHYMPPHPISIEEMDAGITQAVAERNKR